jgi:hypothetical protein
VHVRTVLHVAEAIETNLAIGAAALKSAWLDGEEVILGGDGYLAYAPVSLAAGTVVLDLRFAVEETTTVRAHFAFVADLDSYLRPEWLRVAGPPARDSVVTFSHVFSLDAGAVEARARIGTSSPCRLLIDDTEVGRFGGFTGGDEGPLSAWDFLGTAELGGLEAGEHTVRLELRDGGGAAPAAMFDARIVTASGEEVDLRSDVATARTPPWCPGRRSSGRRWAASRTGSSSAILPTHT